MNEQPRRRWFPFRLRSLLIAAAVATALLAWLGYWLAWIRERREFFLSSENAGSWGVNLSGLVAPRGMFLLGAPGFTGVGWAHRPHPTSNMDEVRRLFPEAKIREVLLGEDGWNGPHTCGAEFPPLHP